MLADTHEYSISNILLNQYGIGQAIRENGLKCLREKSTVADGNSVYLIGDIFVVLVSPLQFPESAAREAQLIKQARNTLHHTLTYFLLDIVYEDRLKDGRSFMVLPKGTPLSSNRLLFAWQKRGVVLKVLSWLRKVTEYSAKPSDATAADFTSCLECITQFTGLPGSIRQQASDCINGISSGWFIPRHTAMHGDLWKGNVIYGLDHSLKLIDWGAFRPDGYGLFDLVKFCSSTGVKADQFAIELNFHSKALGISPTNALGTLLAGCGNVGRNLNEFPRDRFIKMTIDAVNYFEQGMKR